MAEVTNVACVTNENQNDDFFDDNVETDEAAAGSTSASSTAAGGAAAGAFPYRGLAMILIAVAVALGLWALYALTQGGDSENTAASGDTDSTVSAEQGADGNAGTEGANGANNAEGANRPEGADRGGAGDAGREGDAAREGEGADRAGDAARDRDANRAPAAADGADRAGDSSTSGRGAANTPDAPKADVVNVYNNSTITGLAADVSEKLREDGTKVGVESGNIPEERMILTETTVFFDPAVDGAEKKARDLADKVGGVARANVDTLPKEATEGGALTLVLTEQVNL